MASAASIYDFKPKDKKGEPYDFAQLKGKVILVVNTATKCGFTPQLDGLEALYKKYKDQGLVVLGFPCNQFGGQNPQDGEGSEQFCRLNYGVSFPILGVVHVNGASTDDVFKYLKHAKPGLMGLERIKWNFEKFLISPSGEVVARYSSLTKPSHIDGDIAKLLPKAEPTATTTAPAPTTSEPEPTAPAEAEPATTEPVAATAAKEPTAA